MLTCCKQLIKNLNPFQMRLEHLYIKGFKNPEREIDLSFSEEPITVIYGVNGSGKTTLLRVLHAILSGAEAILYEENVKEVSLTYSTTEKKQEKLNISAQHIHHTNYNWWCTNTLSKSKSIFCGTYRGLLKHHSLKKEEFEKIYEKVSNTAEFLTNFNRHNRSPMYYEYEMALYSEINQYFKDNNSNESLLSKNNHLIIDFLSILDVEIILKNQYIEGKQNQIDKINKAFLDTIFDTVTQENTSTFSAQLPVNFEMRLQAQKNFVEDALASHKGSEVSQKLLQYIDTGDRSILNGNKTLHSLMINILEEAELPNPALESVNKVIEIFNTHLYYQKKLVLNNKEVYIQVNDKIKHSLRDLSSGERNLLSLLTTFLIIGTNQKSNFYLIDEPELSLNLKWQREILPLLSQLNPNVQIIAASHSPAIASANSNYLVELK